MSQQRNDENDSNATDATTKDLQSVSSSSDLTEDYREVVEGAVTNLGLESALHEEWRGRPRKGQQHPPRPLSAIYYHAWEMLADGYGDENEAEQILLGEINHAIEYMR